MPLTCHTLHPEAIAWAKAATTNGGTFTTKTLRAVSDFAAAAERGGWRDRFLRLNLVCGTNLAAAAVPLFRGESRTATQYGDAVDVNNGPFVSGDYSEATGIAGNGSTKYFDTTLTLGTLKTFGASYSNVHVSVYKRDSASSTGNDFGGTDFALYQGNSCFLDTSANNFGQAGFEAGVDQSGGHSVVFQSGTAANGLSLAQFYPTISDGVYLVNDVPQAVNITTNAAYDFVDYDGTGLFFCGLYTNTNGDPPEISPQPGANTLSAYSVGKAFTSSGQRTAYYAAMLAFQTALGRAV